MRIIRPEAVKPHQAIPTELPSGTVYTWGSEVHFYLACDEGRAVCLNNGWLLPRVMTNNNEPVRIVAGAFHAEA